MKKTKYEGIYAEKNEYYTKSMVRGSVYGERVIKRNDEEYRHFSRSRSKLAAYIHKGGFYSFKKDSVVLYLGAGAGTTLSHISDICVNGKIYAVEFSKNAMKELSIKMMMRKNVFPILLDARFPHTYRAIIDDVDIIYQDVAQREQLGIFLKNANLFLKSGGCGIIMVKMRSIDVSMDIKKIHLQIRKSLEKRGMRIITDITLDPYHRDHGAFAVMK